MKINDYLIQMKLELAAQHGMYYLINDSPQKQPDAGEDKLAKRTIQKEILTIKNHAISIRFYFDDGAIFEWKHDSEPPKFQGGSIFRDAVILATLPINNVGGLSLGSFWIQQ